MCWLSIGAQKGVVQAPGNCSGFSRVFPYNKGCCPVSAQNPVLGGCVHTWLRLDATNSGWTGSNSSEPFHQLFPHGMKALAAVCGSRKDSPREPENDLGHTQNPQTLWSLSETSWRKAKLYWKKKFCRFQGQEERVDNLFQSWAQGETIE